MVLRLFELNGVSTESVLVPFVASYEVSSRLQVSKNCKVIEIINRTLTTSRMRSNYHYPYSGDF